MTERIRCPACEGDNVDTKWVDDPFQYGEGEDAVMLQVHVPLQRCRRCRLDFLDHVAEGIREEAVRAHLSARNANKNHN